jgi:uncharacterized protein YbaR (Trm112 family)
MSKIDPGLLKILCCPETHQLVSEAGHALISELNTQIVSGSLKNRGGKAVSEKLDGGLLRDDGQVLYPIRDRIPILLIEEAIPVSSKV